MGLERSMEAHQLVTAANLNTCFQTEDSIEGIKSFLEKREPKWTGK